MGLFLNDLKARELTVPLFGKLLFLTWAESRGRISPSDEDLNTLLLDNLSASPKGVKQIVHLDNDVQDVRVRELTDFIFAAQNAGLISRTNPSYKAGELEIGAYDASKLLRRYEQDFGEIIGWLRGRLQCQQASVSE